MPTLDKKLVLVVDDAPANIAVISGILQESFRVKVATSGQKALEIAGGVEQPDLILLDVAMPEMDGFEVCTRLKANSATREIPVIFLTGKTDPIDESKGFALGGVDYIHKPFSPPILLSRVRTHVSLREDRKLSEENIKAVLARKSAVMNAALDCIITIDQQGRIVEFNNAAERTFGYVRDVVIGKGMAELIVPEEYREKHRLGMERFLQTGEHKVLGKRIELPALRADGSTFPAEIAIENIKVKGEFLFTAYLRDISERKKSERDIIDAKDRAEKASEAKSRFLAMMSHEIRTPLNAVLGFLSLLQESRLDTEQRKMVEIARESGESLLSIILDILDFSKMEAGKLEMERHPFDVTQLFDSVVSLLRPQAVTKSLDINLHIADDVPDSLIGYAGRLRQVVLNLLSNAVKFTEEGQIDVSVKVKARHGDDLVILCEVIDTGIGIPEEVQGQIFSEFTIITPSLSRHLGGTGLGLAICNRIVEAAGGEIGFRSRSGVGSTFWFTAPVKMTKPGTIPKPVVVEPVLGVASRKMYVLVADDNPANLLVAKAMLERLGHHVDTVSDGTEVLAALRQQSYDCIFMDVAMPELDGLSTTRAVRALKSDIAQVPIIAMTAYAAPENRRSIFAAGMNDLIVKPVRLGDMARTIDRIVSARGLGSDAKVPVIDLRTLMMLEEAIGKDQTRSSIHAFLDSGDRAVEVMTAAASEPPDQKTLEREAHKLAGGSTQIGASLVRAEAEAIEQACRRGDIETAIRHMPVLSRAWLQARQGLRRHATLVDTEGKNE